MTSEDQLPDFTGKILLVYLDGANATPNAVSHLISNPTFKMQGDRLFLVGTIATADKQGWEGVKTGIAWDSIEKYVVLESLEDFQRRSGILQATQTPAKRGWFS
jgi:hypothetical protein